jgi:hypothetical protein
MRLQRQCHHAFRALLEASIMLMARRRATFAPLTHMQRPLAKSNAKLARQYSCHTQTLQVLPRVHSAVLELKTQDTTPTSCNNHASPAEQAGVATRLVANGAIWVNTHRQQGLLHVTLAQWGNIYYQATLMPQHADLVLSTPTLRRRFHPTHFAK